MNHLFMEPPFIRIVGKDYFPLALFMRQKRGFTRQLHLRPPPGTRIRVASRIRVAVCVINAYYVGCNHIDLSPRDAEVTV